MSFKQFSLISHTPRLQTTVHSTSHPMIGMGKMVTSTESCCPPWQLHWQILENFQYLYFFTVGANGLLTDRSYYSKDTSSPLLVISRRTLPMEHKTLGKIKYIMQFLTICFMPLAFSSCFIMMAGKILQASHLNLTEASVWKEQTYFQRLCSCCLSPTAFAELQFRMKVFSSATSNELI